MVHPRLVELLEGLLDVSGNNAFTLEFARKGKDVKFVEITIKDNLSEVGNVIEKDMNSALIDMMNQIDSFMIEQSY